MKADTLERVRRMIDMRRRGRLVVVEEHMLEVVEG